MNSDNEKSDILIPKAISGNATIQEVNELEVWRNSSPDNESIINESSTIWNNSESYISHSDIEEDKLKIQSRIYENETLKNKKLKFLVRIYRIAAILSFPVALALGWYFFGEKNAKSLNPLFCEIAAPKGHIAKCILPDGTEVWINTNSSITYNSTEFNQSGRNIRLSGEAYFEVKENKEIPFIVQAGKTMVKVTGTTFNLKAFEQSGFFEAVLEEGTITLQLNEVAENEITLLPGKRLVFDKVKNESKIIDVDSKVYSAWRNGEILFKDATLNDLIKELERIYDINFLLQDPQLGLFRFRGMFSYNNNLIDALEKIKKTSGINYYIENKEVWLKKGK